MRACSTTDGSKFSLAALTGVQMVQKWGLLVNMQENALDLLIVFLGKDCSATYKRICSVWGGSEDYIIQSHLKPHSFFLDPF